MTNINLSDELLQTVIAKSIVDTLTPEKRENLIRDAIMFMLKPVKPSYGSAPATSPFEDAFQNAVRQFTHKFLSEKVDSDPDVRAGLESVFAEVAQKLFATPVRDKLVERITNQIVEGLRADR